MNDASEGGAEGVATFFLFFAGLYFMPAIVAAARKLPNLGTVVVVNVLLGWTLIGWAMALDMALRPPLSGEHAAPRRGERIAHRSSTAGLLRRLRRRPR